MSYAQIADLLFLMPQTTIVLLSNDDPQGEEINADVVNALLKAASAEIDAALKDGGVKLPLKTTPPILTELCAVLTRCRLYARRPEGFDFPQAIANACTAARQTLKDIAAGKITLGIAADDEDLQNENYIGGFAKTAAPRSLMQPFVDYLTVSGL